ncbi:MAG: hypothetical protein L0220_02625, partial [Acidobacteria bacterium]|nr:hypothetical protein [Acidobacteriota bacterium]
MAITIARSSLASIVLFAHFTSTSFAIQDLNDWRKVRKEIGATVAVINKTGNRFDGKLIAATDDSLKISDQGQTQELM